MDEFTEAYMEAALFASTDDSGEPLDQNYGISDLSDELKAQMIADCAAFQEKFSHLYEGKYKTASEFSDAAMAGHDFWLTRNGHGAGFWDGDWQDDVTDALDNAASSFGEVDLYIGDDGKIHGSSYTPAPKI